MTVHYAFSFIRRDVTYDDVVVSLPVFTFADVIAHMQPVVRTNQLLLIQQLLQVLVA